MQLWRPEFELDGINSVVKRLCVCYLLTALL